MCLRALCIAQTGIGIWDGFAVDDEGLIPAVASQRKLLLRVGIGTLFFLHICEAPEAGLRETKAPQGTFVASWEVDRDFWLRRKWQVPGFSLAIRKGT